MTPMRHQPDNDSVPYPTPAPGHRDWYAFEALRAMPRILLMVDSNPYSRTYGCFDRSFWHYRTMDFPCGMNQEFVLPLALAHGMDLPGNPYRGLERMRELCLAGVNYAIASSHRDGTCDDYFPFERAMGALVFSLYAMSESCLELGDKDERRISFFAKRGDWLLKHNETGKLANHQAFAALALYNVFLLTGDRRYERGAMEFRDLTFSWGHEEGWFQEYEGADPGYHSCLIAFFAKLWQKSGDEELKRRLLKAVDFAWWFMHPDGSYAGEYGSRNTFHFYPHGFEVLAPFSEKAGQIADSFLHRAMPRRSRYFNDDDRMAAHYIYDWMHAWRDYAPKRPGPVELPAEPQARWFADAKMLVVRERRYHLVLNASKGGTLKITTLAGPLHSDTGLFAETEDRRVLVTHLVDHERSRAKVSADARSVEVRGPFHERKVMLPTPAKQVIFRLLLLSIGRFNANLVRSLLQKKLITGKAPTGLRFRRRVRCLPDRVEILDEVRGSGGERLRRLSSGSDGTSIYVANSNTFQRSRLLPWMHFPEAAEDFNRDGVAKILRTIAIPDESAP